MFRRMRLQLTVICALGTGVVLVGMAAVALRFSLVQLERQSAASFESAVKTVVYHLQSQAVVDQYWLARTEADNALWIRVGSESAEMQHTRQNEHRQVVTARALELAREAWGFAPLPAPAGNLEAQAVQFQMRTEEGGAYLAAVAAVPRPGGWLQVVVVRDRAAERAAMWRMVWGFGLCAAAGCMLLVAFAWVFSGRAARPVEEGHRRQNDFIAAASHELRAPLSVIRMSAGTIRSTPAHPERLAEKIEEESTKMAALLSALLFLSHTDSGAAALSMEPVSPKTMLLDTLEHFEPLAKERGIRLEINLPDKQLPQACCDRQLIGQVLAILTGNALRFTPQGGTVRLGVYCRRASLYLTVDDSGPGVPETERERIFERFYQGDASRSDRTHYGLGLSIAGEIAALHKARLWVETAQLGGARFVLRLRLEGTGHNGKKPAS